MIKEAGGYVTGLDGKPDMLATGGIVAGNEQIHRALCGVLTECAKAA